MIGTALSIALSIPAFATGYYVVPMLVRKSEERKLRGLCRKTGTLVLTFDDGPGRKLTPSIVRLLRERSVKATFFLAGFRAVENPGIIEKLIEDGHELGCHSDKHINAWRATPWRAMKDVKAGYDSLSRWVASNGMYRPPYGKVTLATWAALKKQKAPVGWWTINGGDVKRRLPSPAAVSLEAKRAGGGVVLLHDFDRGPEREEFVLRTTEALLDTAEKEGWAVKTLGDLTGEEMARAA